MSKSLHLEKNGTYPLFLRLSLLCLALFLQIYAWGSVAEDDFAFPHIRGIDLVDSQCLIPSVFGDHASSIRKTDFRRTLKPIVVKMIDSQCFYFIAFSFYTKSVNSEKPPFSYFPSIFSLKNADALHHFCILRI
ncbi:MAG: hypothetical protein PUB21_02325 [Bacteroidales bacterium]|nr:hypothetical protein [Bacteroidales bacterium]